MLKNFRTVILLLSLCFADSTAATTVVYVVTPTGIVIGADGLLLPPAGPPLGTNGVQVPGATTLKIRLLKKRLAVANLDIEFAKSPDLTVTLYDFQTWIKQIDEHTDAKMSVSGLTEFIKNQMRTTFAFEIAAIESHKVTKEQAVAGNIDAPIVRYIIVGYEKGIPVGYSLTLEPNWETHTVNGPVQVLLEAPAGSKPDSYMALSGQTVGISRVFVEGTKEQKEYSARVPVESRLGVGKGLTLKQASNVVRALLGIEAEANPRFVGFPITVVTIPRVGNGWARTYDKDVSALSTLPKSIQPKQR